MIKSVELERAGSKRAAATQSNKTQDAPNASAESRVRSEERRERAQLDRKAVEQWKKVYIDMYGS